MRYWLLKSEPEVFSWDDLVACGAAGQAWDGVRNYAARNHMRAMALGDRGLFYHSQTERACVGIVEVAALAHPDPTDDTGTWDCVDVRAVAALSRAVTLADIKVRDDLAGMALLRQSRLSVQPVEDAAWRTICAMGGIAP